MDPKKELLRSLWVGFVSTLLHLRDMREQQLVFPLPGHWPTLTSHRHHTIVTLSPLYIYIYIYERERETLNIPTLEILS